MKPTPTRRGNPAVALIGGLALLLGACGTPPKPPPGLAPADLPRRVAVLPFTNRSANPEAAVVLRRMFYNFFSSLNYADLEPAVVDATLDANRLLDPAAGPGRPMAAEMLGRLLGVDAVVEGEVLALGHVYAVVYAHQQAALRARMVRCANGQVVWEMEHTVTLHAGDLPLSLPGLAAAIVKTAFTYQQTTSLQAASELCLQMTATIPNPPADTEAPPPIRLLVHNGAAGLLAPGDELRVVMLGGPRQRASFSLPPLLREAPMEEKEPGVYAATYRIRPGDRLTEGRLTAYLRTPGGVSRQWIDTLGPIRVGRATALPPAVAADTVLSAENGPYLAEEALVVMPGATLTLEAGAVVWFRSLGMVVKGAVRALGTAEAPVVFSGLTAGGWKGVFIDGGEHRFRHCRISGAEFGIRARGARLSVERCLLQENTWALVAEGGEVEVVGSGVRSSGKAGISARGARLRVSATSVTENAAGGLLLEGSTALIAGNAIHNNGAWGIKADGPTGEVQAGGNWWGSPEPDFSALVSGGVFVHPPLPVPPDPGPALSAGPPPAAD